jgi:hypothetical protein
MVRSGILSLAGRDLRRLRRLLGLFEHTTDEHTSKISTRLSEHTPTRLNPCPGDVTVERTEREDRPA